MSEKEARGRPKGVFAKRSRPRRILAVGSVALDTVESPFGKAEDVIGGSAVHFAAAASLFAPVQIVGVVGDDYPMDKLDFLTQRGANLSGIDRVPGESFRWTGRYSHDLSAPETLETRLGVFADFRPVIPDEFREPELLFLGNIDPQLQGRVLDQVGSPTMVVCDTMNYWIEGSREALHALLERVDTLIVNEGEIRQLANEPNLLRAARWVRDRGPSRVVVKKGEHGALLLDDHGIFFVPGYPLEQVFDPTGAGDAFAGGFLGALAGWGDFSRAGMRRAVVMGSVTGSLAVESFSVDRLRAADRGDVARRAREFRRMTYFDLDDGEMGNG